MTDIRRIAGLATYGLAKRLPKPLIAQAQDLVGRSPRARAAIRRLTGPARQGTHSIAEGPAKGLLIDVSSSRPSYVLGTAEPDMQRFFASTIKPGDVVLDLGANVGFFTLVAAALTGPNGRVVSYEPMQATNEALRHNVALNGLAHRVEVVQAAVSASDGVALMDANESDQDASLVISTSGDMREVRTVCVDSEVRRIATGPSFIKIDVEGAEADVMEGMRDTLERYRPVVVCEIHTHDHDLDGPVPAILRDFGYRVYWLEDGVDSAESFWAPHLVGVPANT